MKNLKFILVPLSLLVLVGCAAVKEEGKLIWGSSTKGLESVRDEALKKTFSCSWEQCFDAVLKYASVETVQLDTETINIAKMNKPIPIAEQKTIKVKNFDVFLQSRLRKMMVIMGVPGSVNTTEVAVFFTPIENKGTLLEITSFSSGAKGRAADILFNELGRQFKEVNTNP